MLCCTDDKLQPVYHLRKWKMIPAKINGDTISA
jgi:hypothetical protein